MTIRSVQFKLKPHIYPLGNGRYAFSLRDLVTEGASPLSARRRWILKFALRYQMPTSYAESVLVSHERLGMVRYL